MPYFKSTITVPRPLFHLMALAVALHAFSGIVGFMVWLAK